MQDTLSNEPAPRLLLERLWLALVNDGSHQGYDPHACPVCSAVEELAPFLPSAGETAHGLTRASTEELNERLADARTMVARFEAYRDAYAAELLRRTEA